MQHVHHTRPFGFDRVFAPNGRPGACAEDLSLQIASLESELQRRRETEAEALANARADGFAAGLAQARAETATALLAAETKLVAGIERLGAEAAAMEVRLASSAAELALAAAEHLAARAIADDPVAPVAAAIARVLAQPGQRETLRVLVHPALLEPLRARLGEPQAGRPLALAADAALAPGDAHILWERGGLTLDRAARRAAIAAAIGIDAGE